MYFIDIFNKMSKMLKYYLNGKSIHVIIRKIREY